MGFLSPLKKIGGALGKLPGAKTLTKPINKLAGKTPGLKGMPAAFGMGAKPKSPIAPSPPVVANSMKNAAVGTPTMGAPMAQPMNQSPPLMPPSQGPIQMQEAPEVQPGMTEMASLGTPQPQMGGDLAAALPPQGMPMPMQQAPPPQQNLMAKLQQSNTGVRGPMNRNARYNGIGPSFMG